MKVIDVLKKLGVWENVCIRPSVIHPHDMEALFGVAEEIVYRITTGEWAGSHCIFIIYR